MDRRESGPQIAGIRQLLALHLDSLTLMYHNENLNDPSTLVDQYTLAWLITNVLTARREDLHTDRLIIDVPPIDQTSPGYMDWKEIIGGKYSSLRELQACEEQMLESGHQVKAKAVSLLPEFSDKKVNAAVGSLA